MKPRSRRILLGLLLAVAFLGCESSPSPRAMLKKPAGEPIIRVRVRRGVEKLRLTAPKRVQVYSLASPQRKHVLSTPLTVRRAGGRWSGPWPGRSPAPDAPLAVEPMGLPSLSTDTLTYPGAMLLAPASERGADRFDAINHVRLERYLPGVLDRELYPYWRPAAFLAQAIVARSYAVDRIQRGGLSRYYDVESTQASQAYSGETAHPLAIRAVRDTAGLVLTDQNRIIPAFYSSCCGGAGQAPADAFGSSLGLPPLEPQPHPAWCSYSKRFRWGPVERNRATLARRLAAWGRRKNHPLANLESIQAIRIQRTNHVDRPVRFTITGRGGHGYGIRAEQLRQAANFTPSAELAAPGEKLMSGYFDAEVRGERVVFHHGRGFGHGVGLCQYGAQGMARAGHGPVRILHEYYPGAKVERAY